MMLPGVHKSQKRAGAGGGGKGRECKAAWALGRRRLLGLSASPCLSASLLRVAFSVPFDSVPGEEMGGGGAQGRALGHS